MNKLGITALFPSLLALSATAFAQPRPPTPPGPPADRPMPAHTCDKSGGALFEEQLHAEENSPHEATWTITVYAGGAWERHDLEPGNKVAGLSDGCLSTDQLATIKTELARSTWIVKHYDIACAAIGTTFMTYSVKGKQVWESHVCQTAYLDETSEKAIQTITKLVETVAAPHTPPCCKK